MQLLIFFQISLHFSKNLSFIKKGIHLVLHTFKHTHTFRNTFTSLVYALIFGRNMHKGLIFVSIFVTTEIFKILFTERKLVRYYYFINIYIAYRNRAFMLVKFLSFNFSIIKLYNSFLSFL